jgi:hypothetical protein
MIHDQHRRGGWLLTPQKLRSSQSEQICTVHISDVCAWYAVLILLENLRMILGGAISISQVERVPGSLP